MDSNRLQWIFMVCLHQITIELNDLRIDSKQSRNHFNPSKSSITDYDSL